MDLLTARQKSEEFLKTNDYKILRTILTTTPLYILDEVLPKILAETKRTRTWSQIMKWILNPREIENFRDRYNIYGNSLHLVMKNKGLAPKETEDSDLLEYPFYDTNPKINTDIFFKALNARKNSIIPLFNRALFNHYIDTGKATGKKMPYFVAKDFDAKEYIETLKVGKK